MIGSLPALPRLAVATEGFPPGVAVAAPLLRARGAALVVTSQARPGLAFAGGSFELVISRHPIEPWWDDRAGAPARWRVPRTACRPGQPPVAERVPDGPAPGGVETSSRRRAARRRGRRPRRADTRRRTSAHGLPRRGGRRVLPPGGAVDRARLRGREVPTAPPRPPPAHRARGC